MPVVGVYHWKVGLYGKEDPALVYDRSAAVRVFERLLHEDLIPAGYFRRFAGDNVSWLRGQQLEPCDAGRYSIAIDASGNVAPCLAFPAVGNLLESSFREILSRFDRISRFETCSDCSSCNKLDGRFGSTASGDGVANTGVVPNRKATTRRTLISLLAILAATGCTTVPTSFTPSKPAIPSLMLNFPTSCGRSRCARMSTKAWLTIRSSTERGGSRPIWLC